MDHPGRNIDTGASRFGLFSGRPQAKFRSRRFPAAHSPLGLVLGGNLGGYYAFLQTQHFIRLAGL